MSLTNIRSGQAAVQAAWKRRRVLMLGACALAAPLHAVAQPAKKVLRIGFLAIGARPASLSADALGGFAKGMRELGYAEGRDYVIEWRFTEGKQEAFARGPLSSRK